MNVVLVPRRSDGGQRDDIWRYLKPKWALPVYEGHHDDGEFNRAKALNRAANGRWDVALVCDADCWVSEVQQAEALRQATDTGRMVLAFDDYRYLSEDGTRRLLDGYTGDWAGLVAWSDPGLGQSPFAIRRDLWDRLGGFDEEFVGWGCEDVAFARRCGEIDRVPGSLYHLWHPPAGPSATYEANRQRLEATCS